jgi:integrase
VRKFSIRSVTSGLQAGFEQWTVNFGGSRKRRQQARPTGDLASLRASEIAALQWDDFDFSKDQLLVQRSFVNGRVDDVKTDYSQDYVPLDSSWTEIVLKWSAQGVPTEEGWVFANSRTNRPYYPTEIQKRHLRPSGCCVVECPTCGAPPGIWCNQHHKTGNGVGMLCTRRA